MSKDDPMVQTTISIRKTQHEIALKKVANKEGKNLSQVVGKALDYIDQHDIEFVNTDE